MPTKKNKNITRIVNRVNKSSANFVNRLKDSNRKYIKDWESERIATHKLGVSTDEHGNNYIYPEVQEINGKLIDFTRPPYHPFAGMISAEERGDTVRVNSIEDGLLFTENYKNYYPKGNTFKLGGRRKGEFGLDIQYGGRAIPIGKNMVYFDGNSHENGGIGVGNELEVEGGEVGEYKDNTLRVFSSVPFLRGVSPAQLVMGGANPNKVFKAQENFKDINRINDDGTRYEMGGQKKSNSAIRTEDDKKVSARNRAIYSAVDATSDYPTWWQAIGLGIGSNFKTMVNPDSMNYTVTDSVADAAWRKRLGLSYSDKFLIPNKDGSVRLPRNVEMEIPTDTTMLKKRIAANEKFANQYNIVGEDWQIVQAMMKKDKEALEALRKTYKTGEPVVVNEYAHNTRKLSKNGELIDDAINYKSPLNVMRNYTIQYDPKTRKMNYWDTYDFNEFEWGVPGKPFKIRGSVPLKRYGGSMIYTINGNVKNGLMSARTKAQYGTIDKKDKDTKVGQDGLIYKRAADGEWYTDGTVHVTARPIVKNSRNELVDVNNSLIPEIIDRNGHYVRVKSIIPKDKKIITRKFDKPKRTYLGGYDEEEKETKKIGSLTYEKNESGKWVPSAKQSTTTTRDGGRPKDFGMTRTGVNHPNGIYKYHPLTGEKISEMGVVETSEPSIKGTTKVSSSTSSTPRGRGTKSSKPATSTKPANVEAKQPKLVEKPKENLYITGIKNNAVKSPIMTGMEKISANPASSSTGGGTQSKDGNWVPQYNLITGRDWLGVGTNLAGHIASYFANRDILDRYPMPTKPVMAPAVKLKTRVNINPDLTNSKEAELMGIEATNRNTSSSNTTLARNQRIMNESRDARNKLYAYKENAETKLINQDNLNRQGVYARNVAAYNDWLNKTYVGKTNKLLAKQQNLMSLINGIPMAVNNVLGNIETRKSTNDMIQAIAAANPNGDGRLLGIGDYYTQQLGNGKIAKYNKNHKFIKYV